MLSLKTRAVAQSLYSQRPDSPLKTSSFLTNKRWSLCRHADCESGPPSPEGLGAITPGRRSPYTCCPGAPRRVTMSKTQAGRAIPVSAGQPQVLVQVHPGTLCVAGPLPHSRSQARSLAHPPPCSLSRSWEVQVLHLSPLDSKEIKPINPKGNQP